MGKKKKGHEPPAELKKRIEEVLSGEEKEWTDELSSVSLGHWLWFAEQACEGRSLERLKRLEGLVKGRKFQKGLRGIYHKLRSQGVEIEVAREKAFTMAREVHYEGVTTMASIEGEVVTAVYRQPPGEKGAMMMLRLLKNQRPSLDVAWVAKGEARQMVREIRGSGGGEVQWIDVPAEYAAHLMYGFMRIYQASNAQMDAVDAEVMTHLGRLPERPREHPVMKRLRERGVAVPKSVGIIGDLMEDPFFAMLWPERSWVEACAAALG